MNLLFALFILSFFQPAEYLRIQIESGDFRLAFRVSPATAIGSNEVLAHDQFECWRNGVKLDTTGHEVGFSEGPWGYILWVRPSATSARISLLNHSLTDGITRTKPSQSVEFRPGWYPYAKGQTLGLKGAPARLEISADLETPASPRRASLSVLVLAALLGGGLLTAAAGHPVQAHLRRWRPPAR